MFEWLKRRNIQIESAPSLYLHQNEQGLAWTFETLGTSLECGILAQPILQQLGGCPRIPTKI